MALIVYIFLCLFIVFVVVPILRFLMWLRQARSQVRNMWNDATGSDTSSYSGSRQRSTDNRYRGTGKIYSADEGEYVEFEEIIEDRVGDDTAASTYRNVDTGISDARYEEIKV